MTPLWRPSISWLTKSTTRWAFVGYWLALAVTSWLNATPLWLQLSRVVRHHPEGDAILFEPGGLMLLEVLNREQGALGASLTSSLVGFVLSLPIWLYASAVLWLSFTQNRAPPLDILRDALLAWPAFAALWFSTRLCQALLLGLVWLVGANVARLLVGAVSERTVELVLLSVVLLGGIACVLAQYAAALVAARLASGQTPRQALRAVALVVQSGPLAPVWLTWSSFGLVLPLAAAWLAGALPPGAPLLATAALQQGAFAISVAAQAAAMASAVEWMRIRGDDLVQLGIPASGPLPAEVEPHDAPP